MDRVIVVSITERRAVHDNVAHPKDILIRAHDIRIKMCVVIAVNHKEGEIYGQNEADFVRRISFIERNVKEDMSITFL